jgi:hypothetical protein
MIPAGITDAESLYQRGMDAARAGDPAQGLHWLRMALAQDQDHAAWHAALGGLHQSQAQWPEAARAFHRAARLEPSQWTHFLSLVTAVYHWSHHVPHLPPAQELRPVGAPFVSVIVCSIRPDRERRIRAMYQRALAGVKHELLVIHDARSLCEGYNRAVARSRGEILIFSHDDIDIISSSFAARLLHHLRHADLVGVAGSARISNFGWTSSGWPWLHGQVIRRVPGQADYHLLVFNRGHGCSTQLEVLDGLFFAARRAVVDRICFDEQTFDGFHGYDVDFTYTAARAGFTVGVANDILLLHESAGQYDDAWRRYGLKFMEKYRGQFPWITRTEHTGLPLGFTDLPTLVTFWERMQGLG